MTKSPVTVSVGDTVSDAIAKIRKHRVRELPVMDGSNPVGLVSYSSFVERRSVPLTAKVASIMLRPPTLGEDASALDAAETIVSSGLRGALVIRGGAMVGFVSRTDIIRFVPKVAELSQRKVGDVMSIEPRAVTPDDAVSKVQIEMDGLDEKVLPVVDHQDRIVGAVGMTEVLKVLWTPKADRPRRSPKPPRKVFDDRVPQKISVGSVMTRHAVTVGPEDTVGHAVEVMIAKGLSTLFVADGGTLVGVIDQADIMEQIITLRSRDSVFVQISGLGMYEPDVYDGLYDLIGKGMKRINKIERPKVFYLHVATHDEGGLTSKFSLRARLNTEKHMYYVRNSDWDLFRTASELLESLEGKVRKDKEKELTDRRKTPGTRGRKAA